MPLATYYNLDHNVTADIPFFRAYARAAGGPVLELACGTGRVLLPLARDGHTITGIDNDIEMLAVCRRDLAAEGLGDRVQLHEADMSAFSLPRRDFALIFLALRSFMLLLSPAAQRDCLQHAYRHLRPGATFIVTAIAPDHARLAEPVSDTFTVRRTFNLPDGGHVVRSTRLATHDPMMQVRQFIFKFEEFDAAGRRVKETLVPQHIRYTYRHELEQLLTADGFTVTEIFRDYERTPYDGTGEMILVARR